MVAIGTVIRANASFAKQRRHEAVCVFAGATSGIGARTLERMVTLLNPPATFYILGRSSTRFAQQRKKLETLNGNAKIIFVETEVALISGIDAASKRITTAESRVDYLYMSPGGIPMKGREPTSEGLDTNMAISYYSRVRLIYNMLPLLRQSPTQHVLSVLNAGKEKYMSEGDLGLDGNWTLFACDKHSTCMMSLALEHLSKENRTITFVHNFPGLVESDNFRRVNPPEGTPFLKRILLAVAKRIVAVLRFFIGMAPSDAGERQTYHLTSDKYTPGHGAWRLDEHGEHKVPTKALQHYLDDAWQERIWTFTTNVWEKSLAQGQKPDRP